MQALRDEAEIDAPGGSAIVLTYLLGVTLAGFLAVAL